MQITLDNEENMSQGYAFKMPWSGACFLLNVEPQIHHVNERRLSWWKFRSNVEEN